MIELILIPVTVAVLAVFLYFTGRQHSRSVDNILAAWREERGEMLTRIQTPDIARAEALATLISQQETAPADEEELWVEVELDDDPDLAILGEE
jgi:hypothetical protein